MRYRKILAKETQTEKIWITNCDDDDLDTIRHIFDNPQEPEEEFILPEGIKDVKNTVIAFGQIKDITEIIAKEWFTLATITTNVNNIKTSTQANYYVCSHGGQVIEYLGHIDDSSKHFNAVSQARCIALRLNTKNIIVFKEIK